MTSEPENSPPMVLGFLICDGAHRDPTTGKWTLFGLFNSIGGKEYPMRHPMMIAYLALTDVYGKLALRFELVDSDNDESIFAMNAELTVSDPRTMADLVVPFRDVVFPKQGEYRLQVFAGNQFLIERRLTAMSSTGLGIGG